MTGTRVVNIKDKAFDFDKDNPDHVYIGRANSRQGLEESKWHNPFKVDDDGTREEVIRAYREWIKHQPHLLSSIEELRGKTLVCWCSPEACHGHVLVEMLEGSNDLKLHPVADLFPPMTEVEFLGLKENIREHGQREDIVVWRGMLVDGRHRWRACKELGIEPQVAELMDETDPVQYAISHNLHRRHLDTAQRAMIADKLATMRQGDNQHSKEDSGIPLTKSSQSEAASLLNVSVDSVKTARKVRKEAEPEVVAAVERGKLSLNAAVQTVNPKPVKPKPKAAEPKSKPTFDDIVKRYPEITGIHPVCLTVPTMSESAFDLLAESISAIGLQHEIVLTKEGLLIDGRARLRACDESQVKPRFKRVATDPSKVLIGENIARSHLTEKQIAVFMAAWSKAKQEKPTTSGNQ